MSFIITHRYEETEHNPPLDRLWDLLKELEIKDEEHPEVSVTHESGWCVAAYGGGHIIWENAAALIEKGLRELDGKITEGRHMTGVHDEKIVELWTKLAQGDIAAIEAQPWRPGSFPPRSAEEQARRRQEMEAHALAHAQEFYQQLGPEDPAVRCRHPGCQRGRIRFSVFCRMHHFESLKHKPCPFDD